MPVGNNASLNDCYNLGNPFSENKLPYECGRFNVRNIAFRSRMTGYKQSKHRERKKNKVNYTQEVKFVDSLHGI